MIRKLFYLIVWGVVMATIVGPGSASAQDVGVLGAGLKAYNEGRYTEAAEHFNNLVHNGARNGPLYYNLGNAYLKAGDLGRATMWYERALRYMPRDPDLRFNLAHARSLVKDEKEAGRNALVGVIFFLDDFLPQGSIQYAAIGFNLILFVILGGYYLGKRYTVLKGVAAAALAATILFTSNALYQFYQDEFDVQGVVLAKEAPVRSGLSEQAAELFVLHAGTKVQVEDQKDGYVRIAFSADKIGWIKKEQLGVI